MNPRAMKASFRILLSLALSAVGFHGSVAKADSQQSVQALVDKLKELKATKTLKLTARPAGAEAILPSKYYNVADEKAAEMGGLVQRIIDDVTKDILSSKTGKDFCFALGSNPSHVQASLGVSSSAAAEIASACSSSLFDEAGTKGALSKRDSARKFIMVLTPTNDSSVDSFTKQGGLTILTLETSELTRGEIAKRLAHELAIAFDSKFNADVLWLSKVSGLTKLSAPNCQVISKINQPIIRFAFATERAYRVESAILSELSAKFGYDLPRDAGNPFASEPKCAARIQALAEGLDRQRAFYAYQTLAPAASESLMVADMLETLCVSQEDMTRAVFGEEAQATPQAISQTMSWLSQQRVRMANQEMGLCEYLTMPEPRLANTNNSRGPRPRIKGW